LANKKLHRDRQGYPKLIADLPAEATCRRQRRSVQRPAKYNNPSPTHKTLLPAVNDPA